MFACIGGRQVVAANEEFSYLHTYSTIILVYSEYNTAVGVIRVLNRPEFSGRHDFRAEKFGRQCAKSGSHTGRPTRKLEQKINIMQKYIVHTSLVYCMSIMSMGPGLGAYQKIHTCSCKWLPCQVFVK